MDEKSSDNGKRSLDLLQSLRSIKETSRYAHTSTDSDTLFMKLHNLKSPHRRSFSDTSDGDRSEFGGIKSVSDYEYEIMSRNSAVWLSSQLPAERSKDKGKAVDSDDCSSEPSSSSTRTRESLISNRYRVGVPSTSDYGDRQDDAFLHEPGLRSIFESLANVFGFQHDNVENQLDALLVLLNSRAARSTRRKALTSIHADYIGGTHANFRSWYLSLGFDPSLASFLQSRTMGDIPLSVSNTDTSQDAKSSGSSSDVLLALEEQNDELWAPKSWYRKVRKLSDEDKAIHVALWLLVWGEASNVRFMPECLCFIFFLACDYLYSGPLRDNLEVNAVSPGTFLDNVITPIYQFILKQGYKEVNGKFVKRERDHAQTVGYDDANELFWDRAAIENIKLKDKTKLMSLSPSERYLHLKDVAWDKSFHKTFLERRTVFHLVTNYQRIWVLHLSFFYYFMAWVAGPLYAGEKNFNHRWAVISAGGSIGVLVCLFATILEMFFVSLNARTLRILGRRMLCLVLLLVVNLAPIAYVVLFAQKGIASSILAYTNLALSAVIVGYLVWTPNRNLFSTRKNKESAIANPTFTANFPPLKRTEKRLSVGLWAMVFVSKLLESLFFLTLPVGRPLKIFFMLRPAQCGDAALLCMGVRYVSLVLLMFLVLILFFLDTYMWWIVWSTALGVVRSLYMGLSILTPWRNVFARLPDRMYAKMFASNMVNRLKPKHLCSQLWNAIIVAMYSDHVISLAHLDKLLYHEHYAAVTEDGDSLSPNDNSGTEQKITIEQPRFFTSQEDISTKTEFFPKNGEADRRLTYFAQSLSMAFPEPMSVQQMPTFSVLTPHYSEKILLSLREIIREHDPSSTLTLLEYLKALHPHEWQFYIEDSRSLSAENEPGQRTSDGALQSDKLFHTIGFKHATPDAILRTRIWASLRSQTLYRTVSGFMNYAKAIRLLYKIENPHICNQIMHVHGHGALEKHLDNIAQQKFYFVVAMQRLQLFTEQEHEDVELLLSIFPNLRIAYLEEEDVEAVNDFHESAAASSTPRRKFYYSVLIDGYCEKLSNGRRRPRYRIKLPGPPILGDGKADNQNHSIIFVRGEVVQLVDANQDHYFEEALKIRSVLAEFESCSKSQSYGEHTPPPIAIVGGREYIFSERVGVLGDVAAGKEYTFGTMAQRVSSKLGGRLHYGHPDFLNVVFMTSRGGVSKGTKSLHVNEDIYAGMNALQRGGRIVHTEYLQCGKGRDLGFSSILKFVAKIGGGMGEQMLSREQYYLGTQLPLDRLFTFYYAHGGFHVNNMAIMLSIQLFIYLMLITCSLMLAVKVCDKKFENDDKFLLRRTNCVNLFGVFKWIKEAVLAIVVVFAINFLPLFMQVFAEQGVIAAITRLAKQVGCLSPLFDVFTTQIYSHTVLNDLAFGRAGYISTGRSFATARIPFYDLYSSFASPSLYLGGRLLVALWFVNSIVDYGHLAFFWMMVLPLVISPFLFNPHQFKFSDFMLDYGELLSWFSRGNGTTCKDGWIKHHRVQRAALVGHKRTTEVKKDKNNGPFHGSEFKKPSPPASNPTTRLSRPKFVSLFFTEVFIPLIVAALSLGVYGIAFRSIKASMIMAALSLAPVAINSVVLLVLLPISLFIGPIFGCFDSGYFGGVIAGIAHMFSVVAVLGAFGGIMVTANFRVQQTLLGVIAMMCVQRAIFRLLTVVFVTREFEHDGANLAWWTGIWIRRGLGWNAIVQPLREFVCKIIEMSSFAMDFILAHAILFILFPLTLIPKFDRLHTLCLLWMAPKQTKIRTGEGHVKANGRVMSKRQRAIRRTSVIWNSILFVSLFLVFVGIIVVPQVLPLKSLVPVKVDVPI